MAGSALGESVYLHTFHNTSGRRPGGVHDSSLSTRSGKGDTYVYLDTHYWRWYIVHVLQCQVAI